MALYLIGDVQGCDRALQHLRQAHPVRQPREFVEVGLSLQLFPLLARVRDVVDREVADQGQD